MQMPDNINQAQPLKSENKNSALWFFVILFFIISVAEGVTLAYVLSSKSDSASQEVKSQASTSKLNLPLTPATSPTVTPTPETKIQALNKEYLFPLKDFEGKEITQIKYLLKQYEFTKEVFVNYQKALITNEKIVLAFDIDITNDSSTAFEIITRDYLRLSINNEDKWIAPEIHDDPVEVRPHSTKTTKVGFTINETDTDIKLQVGEPDNPQETIKIL